jgi:sugar phosphate permease
MGDAVSTTPNVRPVSDSAPVSAAGSGDRRWLALVLIAIAQLMVALDATIVSIALPSAQSALRVSDAERQWVITAYTLASGGLLLLGGRIADYMGRKRTFLVGLAGFAAASAVGGASPSFGILLAARAMQGAFAALLAPTALSLLAVTFTEPRERAKGIRGLRCRGRQRGSCRIAPGRGSHPVPELALVPVRQPAHRGGGRRRGMARADDI